MPLAPHPKTKAPDRRRPTAVPLAGVPLVGVAESAAEFVITPGAAQTSRDRRAWVRALLKRVEDAADQAGRSGEAMDLTIRIRPAAEPATASPVSRGDALDRQLVAARARGAVRVAEILNAPDMICARDFGPLVGMSHETVNQKRRTGELLGLRGATRGYRFPIWQVTPQGLPLPGLKALFEMLGGDPWTVYRFLLARHNELAGETGLEALKAGRSETVLGAARNVSAGAFA